MAQRTSNFTPQVIESVAEQPDRTFEAIASVGAQVAEESGKAKMLAASANVQTGFKKMDADFRLQYADDPTNEEGLKGLAESRQQLTDQYAEGIPLVFRRQWNQDASEMALQSSVGNDLWGADQQRVNTVKNINDSINTYLTSAQTDGMAFGKDNKAILANTLDYLDARGRLEMTGTPIVGGQKTQELLKDFDSDYVKTFVAGVVETNPQKAIDLLSKPEIRDTFRKPEEYTKFKEATEVRARHVYKNEQQGGVLSTVKTSNAPLMTGQSSMSYTQLQQADLTPAARDYYEELNGFKGSGKRGGFTPEDKANYKLAIFDSVQKLSQDKSMDASSVRVVQDSIYTAMNKGAITEKQGMEYINQLVSPLVAKKEKAMAQFSEDHWFSDDIGFGGVQDFYDKSLHKDTAGLDADTRRHVDAQNAITKSNLYDYYAQSLGKRAAAGGTTVGDLDTLPAAQKKAIYASAQTDAQALSLQDKHPALRTMPDTPNFVYQADGTLVPGMVGKRELTPAAAAKSPFKLQRNKKTGETRRVYPDGRVEVLGNGS